MRKSEPNGPSLLLSSMLLPEFSDGGYRVGLFDVSVAEEGGSAVYTASLRITRQEHALLLREFSRLESRNPAPPELPNNLGELIAWLTAYTAPGLAAPSGRAVELAELLSYEYVGLSRLMPLIKDGKVDEVYLDSPREMPYGDHREFGRCVFPVQLAPRELEAIRTHAEIYGGESASLRTPSIKSELIVGELRMRVGIDVPPLSPAGMAFHVRKVGAAAPTLAYLVRNGTLAEATASYMVAMASCGVNLTIIGPSGSGKTTLLNALDMALDPSLRRIYVEDAIESLDLHRYGYRQTKLRVPPLEAGGEVPTSKQAEVLKALHRSPDLLILGEIQDEGHSRALFQALASGIVGLQTFHASGPEQAVRRWTELHGIKRSQLEDLGLIVTMRRPNPLSSRRVLERVSEIDGQGGVRDTCSGSAEPAFPVGSALARRVDQLRGKGALLRSYESARARLRRCVSMHADEPERFVLGFFGGVEDVCENTQHMRPSWR
ncbi:MAG: type II/IV secretion system ATPase subunit [Nitrososphaerota archaeon]|nr:type II/IV secretion system ATPase subunit [Nitrososphaerota archaeon]